MQKRSLRSPSRRAAEAARDGEYPPGLGFTPRSQKSPRSPPQKVPQPTIAAAEKDGSGLPCLVYVVAYHALVAGSLLYWHYRAHGVVNVTHALLAVFLTINLWICVCELALLCYPLHIQHESAGFIAKYGDSTLPPVFLFLGVRLRDLFTLKYWSVMWSTYATLDASYVNTATFGYCVDVCNGMSTLLPTVVFALGMTFQTLLSPRVLGMLGLVSFYQEFYGTVVYYFQFFFNRRHDKLSRALVLGVVVPANAIWIVLPALGMWASSRLIRDGTFEVFL